MTVAIKIQPRVNEASRAALRLLDRLFCEECGQDLIEYALVFSFVALGAIASMKTLSTTIASVFGAVGTTLTTAT